jgi:hypothetical protein
MFSHRRTGGARGPCPPPPWLRENYFVGLKKTRRQVDGRMAPPFRRMRSGLRMLRISELDKVSKKRSSSCVVLSKKWSTDDRCQSPKKGRQLFVAVNMAPPWGNSWVRHCVQHCWKSQTQLTEFINLMPAHELCAQLV